MPTTPFVNPTAIGYARVSTTEQATTGWSIDEQVAAIRTAANAMGVRLVAVLTDPGRSGSSLKRPGLKSCVDLIASRSIGVLLVTRSDRLSRSLEQTLALRQWIHLQGTDLYILDGQTHLRAADVALGSPSETDLMVQLQAIFAEHELSTVRARILPNLRIAALAGRRGGWMPLGYQRDPDGRIVVNDHDAALLARCVEAVRAGTGISTLSRRLVVEQVRDSQGSFLTFDRIRGALTNPYMTGELVYHLPPAVADGNEIVRLPDHHPRLIDPLTFAALERILHRPSDTTTPAARRQRQRHRGATTDILSAVRPPPRPIHGAIPPEIARCGHCQGPLYSVLQTQGSRGDRRRVPIYQCRYHKDRGAAFCPQPPVPVETVDEAVFARLCKQWASRTGDAHRTDAVAMQPEAGTAAATPQNLAAVDARVERLQQALATLGTGAPAQLKEHLAQAQRDQVRMATRVQAAQATGPDLIGPAFDLQRRPLETWQRLDPAGRREAVRPYLLRVVVTDKKVTRVELVDADHAPPPSRTTARTP